MLKIKYNEILSFLVFLIYIKPGFVEDIDILDFIWNTGRFGLTIVFVLKILLKDPTRLKYLAFPISIFLISFFSTVLHHGNIRLVLGHWIPVLGLMAWFEINKKEMRNIFPVLYKNGGILIIINLITVLLFPQGMWMRGAGKIYILGSKQDLITCFLPTFFFGVITYWWNKNQGRYFYVIFCSMIITLVIIKPVGLIICFILALFLLIVDKYFKSFLNIKILVSFIWIAEVIAIWVAYNFENLNVIQSILGSIVINGYEKTRSMGVRFQMWVYSFEQIKESPLLGMGNVFEDIWYKSSGLDFYHTIIHNLPLDIGFVGGGLALGVFLLWTISNSKKLNKLWNYQEAKYIGIFMFVFCIICITECPYQPFSMSFLAYPIWIRYFINTNISNPNGTA